MTFIALLCLFLFSNTFSIGAFPPLLADIGRARQLSDVELGSLAAAFGFARLVADIPVGLFLANHLRRGFVLASLLLLAGLACLASGGTYPVLVFGRALMGVGHSLGMMAALTAILRYHAGPRLSLSLNAVEFSAMIGMLGGATIVSALPTALAWNRALLVACAPVVIGLLAGPWLMRQVPRPPRGTPAPLFARAATGGAGKRAPARTPLVTLAFAAGGTVALGYSTMEQFALPIRGTRELGLDRSGVARLLMLMQACDIVALLPVGRLSDRLTPARVLSVVVVVLGIGAALVGLGPLPLVTLGCVLLGLGMAGWMLPLGVVRRETPAGHITWRTAMYRVGVDAGGFLGPFVSGLLGESRAFVVPIVVATALLVIGAGLHRAARAAARAGAGAAA